MLPAYLERAHDQQLRNRLSSAVRSGQTMFALVRGTSCAGKTRTAFEAVRACLPDWQLVYPKTPEGLLALLDAGALAPRTVLWLNEAQNHLRGSEGEEAAAALHSRLEETGPVVILGTLWPEYHRDLTATPQPGQGREDAHPNARALLARAVVVDVPASFTTESLKNPLVKRDPAIAAAAHTSTGGKITQTLAAGPQLVDHYEQATEPHGPYGHAVITAAMDARRLGHTSPLPAALLKAAAQAFLTEEQRAGADPATWFDHALAYARQKVRSVAAALEPVANPDGMGPLPDVYHLSDYLDHHARTTRRYTFPPEPFWTAAQEHASTTDLPRLASAARERGRIRIAAGLSQRAADAGDCSALVSLAGRREWDRDWVGAERLYQRAADAGDCSALVSLAVLREWAGDMVGAERLYQQAADAGHTEALWRMADRRERAGDMVGAERLYQQAADAGHHMALATLAVRRERAGDTVGAEQLYQQAADAGHHWAQGLMAVPREQAGDTAGAERYAQRAADAGDTLALVGLARVREEAGDTAGAERLYQQAADAGDQWALVSLAARLGAGADRYLQQAADAGHTKALVSLAGRREQAGDTAGAERLYQQAADAGHTKALVILAERRERAGDTAGAERLYQQAADAGDHWALKSLAIVRERAGDAATAERLQRFGLEADGSPAQPWG